MHVLAYPLYQLFKDYNGLPSVHCGVNLVMSIFIFLFGLMCSYFNLFEQLVLLNLLRTIYLSIYDFNDSCGYINFTKKMYTIAYQMHLINTDFSMYLNISISPLINFCVYIVRSF